MDTRDGTLYETKQAALDAGVPEDDIAEVRGHRKAIGRLRMACKHEAVRRAKRRKLQRASRKANR